MGYVLIDEDKLEENISKWNSLDYRQKVENDVYRARASMSHLLEALQREEKEIDEKILKLQEQKSDIEHLMRYAKEKV